MPPWISIWFLLPLLTEGLGLPYVHTYIVYYYISLPFLLFIWSVIKRKQLEIPLRASALVILLLISLFLTSLFSSFDKQVSFELSLYACSLFLFFTFAYNNRSRAAQYLERGTIILGSLFCIWFIILPLFQKWIPSLVPSNMYQFVSPYYFSHNHLGDFVGLVLVILLFRYFEKKPNNIFSFLVFLPFFLFSYSRSAYASLLLLVVTMIFSFKKIPSKKMGLFIFTLPILVFTFFALVSYTTPRDQGQKTYVNFLNLIHLSPRDLIETRLEYVRQGVASFREHPLWGVGLGNFLTISNRSLINPTKSTDNAHNIFMEILVGNGILGFIPFFLLMALLITYGIRRNRSLSFFLFLYLFLNFQTDYTYQIYGFLALSALFAGIFYQERDTVPALPFFGFLSFLLFSLAGVIVLSTIYLSQSKSQEALQIYPLNRAAYRKALESYPRTNKRKEDPLYSSLLTRFEYVTPTDMYMLTQSAEYYRTIGQHRRALTYYQKMFETNRFVPLPVIEKIYNLTRRTESTSSANIFFNEVVGYYSQMPSYLVNERFREDFIDMCSRINAFSCSRLGW